MYPRCGKLLSNMHNCLSSARRRKRVGYGSILSFQLAWANWSESDLLMEMEKGFIRLDHAAYGDILAMPAKTLS